MYPSNNLRKKNKIPGTTMTFSLNAPIGITLMTKLPLPPPPGFIHVKQQIPNCIHWNFIGFGNQIRYTPFVYAN
jgi:hypothetical protein